MHFEAKYTSVEVTLTPKRKVDYKCTDSYIIGSTMNWNAFVLKKEKTHKITFKHVSADQIETIEKLGLRIYRVCD